MTKRYAPTFEARIIAADKLIRVGQDGRLCIATIGGIKYGTRDFLRKWLIRYRYA